MGAPPGGAIQAMAAATQSGGNGAVLFTIDPQGSLWYASQQSPAGPWTIWVGPGFASQPAPGVAVSLAGQNNGRLMLVMLDDRGMVWTLAQQSPSGGWGNWQGPGIAGQKFSYAAIAAGQQSGQGGLQLFAADDDGQIWACSQIGPGAGWSGWTGPGFQKQQFAAGELALSGQNNGCLMLIAEADGELGALPQTRPGGIWGDWSGFNLGGQSVQLTGICACQQGGSRGVQLWGLDANGQIWTLFQDKAGGNWDPWQGPGFLDQPEPFVTIAAAGQGNGCTILFGVGEGGDLWAIAQTAPGNGWGDWSQPI
jgi:hypothetical protein